ncbi:MAG: hypothetical protein JXA41_10755 [Deltaproteobacteria bacterium]|nr:hypothetical protein [Deltaproteobacteria bacterium]
MMRFLNRLIMSIAILICPFFSAPGVLGMEPPLLSGSYVVFQLESGFHGPDSVGDFGPNQQIFLSKSEITLNQDGSYAERIRDKMINRFITDEWVDQSIADPYDQDWYARTRFQTSYLDYGEETVSGTYLIGPDGSIIFKFMEDGAPETMTGLLDDKTICLILGKTEYKAAGGSAMSGIGFGVKKGMGMNKGSITGTYITYIMGMSFHGKDENNHFGPNEDIVLDKSEITFDGKGHYEERYTNKRIRRHIDDIITNQGTQEPPIDNDQVNQTHFTTTLITDPEEILNGTYDVGDDGTITFSFEEDGELVSVTGHVSADGRIFVFGNMEHHPNEGYATSEMVLAVKKAAGLNNSHLKGSYAGYLFEKTFHGPGPDGNFGPNEEVFVGKSVIQFDGDGHFTEALREEKIERQISDSQFNQSGPTDLDWLNLKKFKTTYAVLTDEITGTYQVNSDGTVTLNFMEDGENVTLTAYLSDDGNKLVHGTVEYELAGAWAGIELTFLAKQGYYAPEKGDIDGNGMVSLADVIAALQTITGKAPENIYIEADVNGDAKIGNEEAIYLLQRLGGLR